MVDSTPVVLVFGLWIHSAAWGDWLDLFRAHGYDTHAPGWPGDRPTVDATRANPKDVANQGLEAITAHYARFISTLPTPPVVIGHSFGGLVAQKLLTQGLATAAVAIDPGQIKGVRAVPLAQVRSGLPVLSRPGNKKRAVSLTKKQFRYGFGNALARSESDALFDRWSIPGPGLPLFEATSANFNRTSPAMVDTVTGERGPLLFIAGGKDHTVPAVVVKAARKLYAKSPAVTDLVDFPDRGHSLVFDSGWRDVATHALGWLAAQDISTPAV